MKQHSSREQDVKVGVVGLGFMGAMHLRAHQATPGVRIVAVCDPVRVPVNGILEGVAGNVKKTGDIPLGPDVRVCRKLEEVLADAEIELVDLCTPTSFHADQCVAALKAGKHVLCEKPLARTSAAARRIIEAAAAAPGFLMPAMCMRFWPGWSWLKEVVEKETFGKILAARFQRFSELPSWATQGTYAGDVGGALFDLHIHDVDFVQFLFGQPKSVFSTGVIQAPGGPINHVVTQYVYPAGPAVSAEGGWLLASGFNMGYVIHCERATLDFDLSRGPDACRVCERGKPARIIPSDGLDGYNREIRYMVGCVRQNKRPATVTAVDGLAALELCEAEEQSVRTGQKVDTLPPRTAK